MKFSIHTKTFSILLICLMTRCLCAEPLSIFDIQHTTSPDGQSPKHNQVVSCIGGIVTLKITSGVSRPRLIIQDPIIRNQNIQDANCSWSAIQVKDWYRTTFNNVNLGDWIELSNVTAQDYRGTTFLQYWTSNPDSSLPSFNIVSTNNPIPQYLPVNLDQIKSPLQDPDHPLDYYVEDHNAEQYESMLLRIDKVKVSQKDNGKDDDNYTLQSFKYPNDPNFSCWAADYFNTDKVFSYHPLVELDQQFCSVYGILEQYTSLTDGWDYYQFLTTETADFFVEQPADIDFDCDVDFADFAKFSKYWLTQCQSNPQLCGNADIITNGIVDANDLMEITYYWLDGTD